MSRRRILLAYDIRDDRRLRDVAVCAEAYGTRIQYSVFICDLTAEEVVRMRGDLERRILHTVDSVMLIDLGRPEDVSRFTFIGYHQKLPVRGPTII
ncbi:MAG: CRISPR-associated endonuclease Cas2 [Actinomycetota bacterium]|nr:CRISPR-associated endonuclease Cas2 [Actinomycetota bacterium]